MRLKLNFCYSIYIVIVSVTWAHPGGNHFVDLDHKSSKFSTQSLMSTYTEKAKSLLARPTGQIVINMAKEVLGRSRGNSQVLSLNLTNLLILLFLKALIFSAGLIGTGHLGSGGYYGRARYVERSFLDHDEVPLILGYLASEGSGQTGCLYRAACLAPYSAFDYVKAGHAVLKGSELLNPDLKHDLYYSHILKGLEKAALEGVDNVPCDMIYPCSSWLNFNSPTKKYSS
ncbi:uncharacterized protein DMENIID0001_003880 [Sergentomyia squamirostris]